MTAAEWGSVPLPSLTWGGSFFSIGVAVKGLPRLTIVAASVCVAALLRRAAPFSRARLLRRAG